MLFLTTSGEGEGWEAVVDLGFDEGGSVADLGLMRGVQK